MSSNQLKTTGDNIHKLFYVSFHVSTQLNKSQYLFLTSWYKIISLSHLILQQRGQTLQVIVSGSGSPRVCDRRITPRSLHCRNFDSLE